MPTLAIFQLYCGVQNKWNISRVLVWFAENSNIKTVILKEECSFIKLYGG
jgi:hypothetical protein